MESDETAFIGDTDGRMALTITVNNIARDTEIADFPCFIGRSDDCAGLGLKDISVSKKHAVIEMNGSNYFITDLNSKNGVYVNHKKITPGVKHEIRRGDMMEAGRARIRVTETAADAQPHRKRAYEKPNGADAQFYRQRACKKPDGAADQTTAPEAYGPKKTGDAKTALLSGLCSLVFFWSVIGGLVLGAVAVARALKSMRSGVPAAGGLVTGMAGFVLALVLPVVFAVNLAASSGSFTGKTAPEQGPAAQTDVGRVAVVTDKNRYKTGETITFDVKTYPEGAENGAYTINLNGNYNAYDGDRRITSYAAGVIKITATAENGASGECDVHVVDLEAFADELCRLVNEERQARGLHELIHNNELDGVALTRAAELAVSFSHKRPDGSNYWTAYRDHGYGFGAAAENIASGQPSPEAVFAAWMESDGHRASILDASFNNIGAGVEMDLYGRLYWAQLFSD